MGKEVEIEARARCRLYVAFLAAVMVQCWIFASNNDFSIGELYDRSRVLKEPRLFGLGCVGIPVLGDGVYERTHAFSGAFRVVWDKLGFSSRSFYFCLLALVLGHFIP